MNNLMKIVFMMLLIGLLTACGTNNNDNKATDNADNATENNDMIDEDVNDNDNGNNDAATGNGTENNDATNAHVELADEVANKITELEEVKSANVLVTDNNAYVAVELKEGVNETEELKTKISDAAKAEDASFNNVYVSANPDLTKQFNEYGERVRANEPVEGFFDEFTDTVKRVFPDAK
ncbi:YhcN/YlaJ family sporulation lipoprotein [Psychrobacillus sp. NPDC096623]|uniref:YhcN/YlaJ family sporulation lipoprotein n=1 Tax=Psychrobacillus sp. NPDC096623 TaxID=3364492 RepID=UPI0037FD21BD